jgi:phosphatidate cytidylyltransferase
MSPLQNRVLTAAVLLVVFVPALFWAPAGVWAMLVSMVLLIAAHEWARLSHFPAPAAVLYAATLGGIALAAPYLPGVDQRALRYGLLIMAALFWILFAPLWLSRRWRGQGYFLRAAVGVMVLLPTWAALLYLRERSSWVLLAVMAVVWIADSAAFFSGRSFGRHKLAPAISPGKTWEGVYGAVLALVLYASAVSAAVHGLRIVGALVLTMTLLYFSVLGDLFESWIKRVADMKDSGTLLPGHGGMLDRIDALTAALPIAAGVLMLAERYT